MASAPPDFRLAALARRWLNLPREAVGLVWLYLAGPPLSWCDMMLGEALNLQEEFLGEDSLPLFSTSTDFRGYRVDYMWTYQMMAPDTQAQ